MRNRDDTLDRTQFDAVLAILSAIRVAVDNNRANGSDELSEIVRLVHAAESVMCRLPIENERK